VFLSLTSGKINALYILKNTFKVINARTAPIPKVIAKFLIKPLVNISNTKDKIALLAVATVVGTNAPLNP
jgi:hypothetical protein